MPAITINDGNGGANYAVTLASFHAGTIHPKALTVDGLSASNKVYDGTTAATFTGTASLLAAQPPGTGTTSDGKPYTGDEVAPSGTPVGAFDTKHVGTGKAVTITGLALGGAQAGNYSASPPAGLTADVTKLAVTVTAVDTPKTYDGTTASTGIPTITPALVSGDTTTALSQTFDSAAAGTGNKTLTPSITINDGNSGANYDVTLTNFTTGTIHKAPLIIATEPVSVPEDSTATFQVKLSAIPAGNVTVAVSRTSGDSDITVLSGSSLTFTTADWDSYQTVTLAAANDTDADNGTSTITCHPDDASFANTTVSANEADKDTTLTLTSDGNGSTTPAGAAIVAKGVATPISATAHAGYDFLNWTVTSGSATITDANSASTTASISAPATIRANFTPKAYTVSFDKQSGTGGSDNVSVTVGSPMPVATAPTRPGYTFGGYYAGSAGSGAQYYTSAMASAKNWDLAADTTLYAKWTKNAAVPSSAWHFIRGETQSPSTLPVGYYTTNTNTAGTSGSSGSRTDHNVVFGFTLPTLPVGTTLESATFQFEITAAFDSTGGANLPQLHAYLLNSPDPTGTGTSFFYHGISDPSTNTKLVGTTSVSITGTSQVNFPAGQELRSFTLTGDALSLLQSYYSGNTPTRPTA